MHHTWWCDYSSLAYRRAIPLSLKPLLPEATRPRLSTSLSKLFSKKANRWLALWLLPGRIYKLLVGIRISATKAIKGGCEQRPYLRVVASRSSFLPSVACHHRRAQVQCQSINVKIVKNQQYQPPIIRMFMPRSNFQPGQQQQCSYCAALSACTAPTSWLVFFSTNRMIARAPWISRVRR